MTNKGRLVLEGATDPVKRLKVEPYYDGSGISVDLNGVRVGQFFINSDGKVVYNALAGDRRRVVTED